ncbi:unnamed protein product [Onchocerca flexuosa]|uniref:Uncharacterized protein n=1 Tax=Onchocerca flexuosa TaxID=387005 RepID=A0A183H5W3_9BILA|nr:unnamed protein product [Onchocerca flexuosa]
MFYGFRKHSFAMVPPEIATVGCSEHVRFNMLLIASSDNHPRYPRQLDICSGTYYLHSASCFRCRTLIAYSSSLFSLVLSKYL